MEFLWSITGAAPEQRALSAPTDDGQRQPGAAGVLETVDRYALGAALGQRQGFLRRVLRHL